MTRRHVPAVSEIECDRCGSVSAEPTERDAWTPGFRGPEEVNIGNKTYDLCAGCVAFIAGAITTYKEDKHQRGLSNDSFMGRNTTKRNVDEENEAFLGIAPSRDECCQGGERSYGRCHGCAR